MTELFLSLCPQVRHRAVSDEGVLVHLDSGRILVVNAVGLHIINTLTEPSTHGELIASIEQQFDVSRERAAIDLELFLAQLEREQVLLQGTRRGAPVNV